MLQQSEDELPAGTASSGGESGQWRPSEWDDNHNHGDGLSRSVHDLHDSRGGHLSVDNTLCDGFSFAVLSALCGSVMY